jgi:hypothetical protein
MTADPATSQGPSIYFSNKRILHEIHILHSSNYVIKNTTSCSPHQSNNDSYFAIKQFIKTPIKNSNFINKSPWMSITFLTLLLKMEKKKSVFDD